MRVDRERRGRSWSRRRLYSSLYVSYDDGRGRTGIGSYDGCIVGFGIARFD